MNISILKQIIHKVKYVESIEKNIPLTEDFLLEYTIRKHYFEKLNNDNSQTLFYKLFVNIYFNNIFLLKSQKKSLLDVLSMYKQTEFAINKLKILYKYKYKYRFFNYEYDMELRKLDTFPERKTINIVENNTIYNFSLLDLCKIIFISITNVEEFVHYPYRPMNPFTNTPFSFSNMVNIYFKFLISGMKIKRQLMDFYDMGFNLEKFSKKYYLYSINNYVTNDFLDSQPKIIYNEIYQMYENAKYFKVTTKNIKPYEEVCHNKKYIYHLRNKFRKALENYIMMTIVNTDDKKKFYIDVCLYHFQKVIIENPDISNFELFEINEWEKKQRTLFNTNTNRNIVLFGNTSFNTNSIVPCNGKNIFGDNPF